MSAHEPRDLTHAANVTFDQAYDAGVSDHIAAGSKGMQFRKEHYILPAATAGQRRVRLDREPRR